MTLIVETHDLTRTYGEMTALDHLNLQIPEGAIFGFIGPNGAGKTTTMRILTTLLQPTSGQAYVNGISVTQDPKGVRRMVGFMPDFFGMYDNMKSWEYLDFFGRAYSVPFKRRTALIGDLLELVDLSHKRDAQVMSLSRGMKQRLSLARTMIHDPKLLILDEPASGLDPRARIELRELLKELRALGKTIMISSHILTELAEMCTHIGIIERGRLLASGDVQTIIRSLQPHTTLEIRVLDQVERALALLRAAPNVRGVRRLNALNNNAAPEGPTVPTEAEHTAVLNKTVQPDETIVALDPTMAQTLQVEYAGDERSMGELLHRLVMEGVVVTRFAEHHSDLEDIFMQVTANLV